MSARTEANVVLPEDDDPRSAAVMLQRFGSTVDPKFHLTVEDCGEFRVSTFSTLPELVAAMIEQQGHDVHMFVHCGFCMKLAPGKLPFMVLPDDERVPLFVMPEELKIADDGFLGTPIVFTHLPETPTRRTRQIDLPSTTRPAQPPTTAETPVFPTNEDGSLAPETEEE